MRLLYSLIESLALSALVLGGIFLAGVAFIVPGVPRDDGEWFGVTVMFLGSGTGSLLCFLGAYWMGSNKTRQDDEAEG